MYSIVSIWGKSSAANITTIQQKAHGITDLCKLALILMKVQSQTGMTNNRQKLLETGISGVTQSQMKMYKNHHRKLVKNLWQDAE